MAAATSADCGQRARFLKTSFDVLEADRVLAALASPREGFRYVVTPNVDHVVRIARDPSLGPVYDGAWLSICDSKPIFLLARALSVGLPHLPGASLTEILFKRTIAPGARVALLAPSEAVALAVRDSFPALQIDWLAPPPEVAKDPAAFRACVEFVATSGADFTFIAIGSPTSERIAHEASLDPRAGGVALCIGAALEFLVGQRRRAPQCMQVLGLEWAYRLCAEPKRLWRRYLLGAGPLVALFVGEIRARGLAAPGAARTKA